MSFATTLPLQALGWYATLQAQPRYVNAKHSSRVGMDPDAGIAQRLLCFQRVRGVNHTATLLRVGIVINWKKLDEVVRNYTAAPRDGWLPPPLQNCSLPEFLGRPVDNPRVPRVGERHEAPEVARSRV